MFEEILERKHMEKINDDKYEWFLEAKKDGKHIVAYPCPKEIIGNIISLIVVAQQRYSQPTKCHVRDVQKLLDSELTLNKRVLSKLTGIEEQQIEQLTKGTKISIETRKLIALAEIIAKLRE